jgi:CDP-glycerol glycerophosphotransferase
MLQPKTAGRLLKRLSQLTPWRSKDLAKRETELPSKATKSKRPDLTVVVPVYNVEDFIEETLNSLLSQTLRNWEAIVIDDGSTDRSSSIVDRFRSADNRIKVIHQSNRGLGAARNVGIAKASGRYLTFLDSDDIIPENAYKAAVKKLDKSGSDFAIGATYRLKNGKKYAPSWTTTVHDRERSRTNVAEFPELMMDVIACNRIFSKKFWDEQIGRFPENVAYEDHRVMVAASLRAEAIDILTTTTYIWRVRESSISQSKHELKNLRDRAGASAEALEILRAEAPTNVLDEWFTRILDTGIPLFAKHAVAADEDYKQSAKEFARKYTELAPAETWRNVRWEQRIKVALMSAGRWDDLAQFMLDLRLNTSGVPGTNIRSSQIELASSSWARDWASRAGTQITLGERLTPLTARIHQTEWVDTGLRLVGFAYISNVETSLTDDLSVRLVAKDGSKSYDLPNPLKVQNQYASKFANHTYFDYSESGIELEIPWSLFIEIAADTNFSEKDTWRIEITRTTRQISRTGIADNYLRNGSGAAFLQRIIPEHFNSVVLLRDSNAFSLRVKNVSYALTKIRIVSGEIAGTVAVPPHSELVPTHIHWDNGAESQQSGAATAAKLEISKDGREFLFSGLRVPQGHKIRLKARGEGATSQPVVWALPEDEYVFQGSIVAHKTPFGFLDFTNGIGTVVADSVEFEGSMVNIETFVNMEALAGLDTCLESNATGERIPGLVSSLDSNRLNIHFELDTQTPAGRPLDGDFTVLLNDIPLVPRIDLASQMPKTHLSSFYRIETVRGTPGEGRPLKMKFRPPLNDSEAGVWNQKQLRSWYRKTDFEPEEAALFQCYRGETAADNQLAIHKALTRARPELKCYWGVLDGSVAVPSGAIPLIIGSEEWFRVLGGAKYLCNNIDFDLFFIRRPYQKFLQTFHGHAFKSMGKTFWRTKDYSPIEVQFECKRRQDAWTTALMPDEESIQYYKDEYDFNGDYLVAGLPRNDYLVTGDPNGARQAIARTYGIDPSSSKWVLYAPTWRESSATSAWSATMFEELDLDLLAERLGPEWTVLVRGHGYNARETSRVTRSASIVDVTDYAEINDLILASEVAILDYSSLRFDWAITKKPMVFFVPDKTEYFQLRPGLFDFDDSAPGAQVVNTHSVADEILRSDDYISRFGPQLDEFNARFNSLNDGCSAQRVVDSFFGSFRP